MPGIQKGKKHKPGAGRPRLGDGPAVRITVALPPDLAAWVLTQPVNASAFVRGLIEAEHRRPTSAAPRPPG